MLMVRPHKWLFVVTTLSLVIVFQNLGPVMGGGRVSKPNCAAPVKNPSHAPAEVTPAPKTDPDKLPKVHESRPTAPPVPDEAADVELPEPKTKPAIQRKLAPENGAKPPYEETKQSQPKPQPKPEAGTPEDVIALELPLPDGGQVREETQAPAYEEEDLPMIAPVAAIEESPAGGDPTPASSSVPNLLVDIPLPMPTSGPQPGSLSPPPTAEPIELVEPAKLPFDDSRESNANQVADRIALPAPAELGSEIKAVAKETQKPAQDAELSQVAFEDGALKRVDCLRGHCPVGIVSGQLLKANDQVSAEFDGYRYFFASEQARIEFLNDPDRYAPVLGGICAVTFARTGDRVIGNFVTTYKGKQYWFATKKARDQFKSQPEACLDRIVWMQDFLASR